MLKAFYALVFGCINLISRLPFPVLHRISDVLYLIVYPIFGYRKKRVLENLRNSFPEKSPQELQTIMTQFYRHLGDLLIESIKSSTMSQQAFRERYRVTNWDKLTDILASGKSVIVVSPHTGNWEWVFSLVDRIPCTVYAIYQKLTNPHIDGYIKRTRQRFGAVMVSRKETYEAILGAVKRGEQTLSWFAADQACWPDNAHWVRFLNQDTTFHAGYEHIARQTRQTVLFLDILKTGRSRYELTFVPITSNPEALPPGSIVEAFAGLTEQRIQSHPAYWLWSHNRWKYNRTT